MSYAELLDHCQNGGPKIGRNFIRDKLLELTGIRRLPMAKMDLDVTVCRGMYLSARNTKHRLVQQLGGHVIVVARDLNTCWERFIYVKEIMHVFDDPIEATDTGDKFDNLLAELSGVPNAPQRSPQHNSEVECFWRALSCLCPEEHRLQFQKDREARRLDDYAIALKLRIPQQYVPGLFSPDYPEIVRRLRSK